MDFTAEDAEDGDVKADGFLITKNAKDTKKGMKH